MSTLSLRSKFTSLFQRTRTIGIYGTNEKTYSLSYENGEIACELEYIVDTEKSVVFDGERDVLYWDAYDARIVSLYVAKEEDTEMTEVNDCPEWLYQRLVNLAIDDYNWNHAEPVDDEPEQWEAEMAYW